MPLAPYSEPHWFPSGLPAAGQKLYIYPRSGPPLAQLFTDATGTVPSPACPSPCARSCTGS